MCKYAAHRLSTARETMGGFVKAVSFGQDAR